MHRIVLPELGRLLARVGARRLGDQELPVALAEASREAGGRARRGALRGTLDASATVDLHVYNATADRDDGGVLGTRRRASGPATATGHRPLLLKQPGQAWLRIALAADAAALARAGGGALAAQASAAGESRLLAYRLHAPDTRCGDAIAGDLARFPVVLSADDACALGVGDACMVQSEARLVASATLSWDALVAEVVPAFADLARGDAGAFLVEVPADGGAALEVSFTDGVSVAIARLQAAGDRAFRVAVRRQRRRGIDAEAALGVEAGFADPDAVARIAAGALADVLAVPAEALRALRSATSLRQLPARHRPAVATLLERLGITGAEPLEALRERLSELDARLAGRLRALARTRAALLFEAGYRRLSADALLLEAELPETALRRLHPSLLSLDAPTVVAGAAPGAVSLLRDRSLDRRRDWRIGVQAGDWFELDSAQRREDRFLERRRVDAEGEQVRREYLGATRYTARVNGWSTAYGAAFESVDAGDGDGPACALRLWWEEGRLRADDNGFARIADDAVLWGVVGSDAAPALRARLHGALDGVGRCRPRFELLLEGEAAREALARLADTPGDAWAAHLARALPWNARVAGRADCATREARYGPVFAAPASVQGTSLRRRVAAGLGGTDRRLAAREARGEAPWTAWRVLSQAGLARRGPRDACHQWSGAAADLARPGVADGTGDPRATNQALAGAFARLRPAFEQPFTLRTLASRLSGVAAAQARGARLSLAFERAGGPRTLVVAT